MRSIFGVLRALFVWLAGFYDERNPQSFSRLITTVLVVAVVAWDSSYMHHEKKLVDAATLAGQALFMGTFYAVRRIAGAYTDTRPGAQQETKSGEGNSQ